MTQPTQPDLATLFSLSGRRVLMIGVGGIGGTVAAGLAAQGAQVICADRDGDAAERVAEEVGGQAVVLDITDEDALHRQADALGAVDAMVITAGRNIRKRILDYTGDEFDAVVGLNLKGTFLAIKAFGAKMVERGAGSIVCFVSMRAQVVEPGQSAYAAAKAGVVQLVKTAAAEFGPAGVRVNAIAPGVIDTPLAAQIKADPAWHKAYAEAGALGRWGRPHELAGAVVYLASDASSFVTGSVLNVDGGWTAVDGRFTPPLG